MRDEFPPEVRRAIAARAGNRCSNPDCGALTSGPQVDPAGSVNVGVAAHITAASEGGPRYDKALTPHQRTHAYNGIWLCQTCAKLIDSDLNLYPSAKLRMWKHQAEANALAQLGKAYQAKTTRNEQFTPEEIDLLVNVADSGEIILLSAEQLGKWVRAGTDDFVDEADPAYAMKYIEALESLIRRKLARYDEGNLFTLTSEGFKVARILRDLDASGQPRSASP